MKLWIPGDPKPQPRHDSYVQWKPREFAIACTKIAGGLRGRAAQKELQRALFVKHYMPGGAKGWRRSVEQAVMAAGIRDKFPKGVPLLTRMSFVFKRPDSHFGTGRNAGVLKERAQDAAPTGRNIGDVDNLEKAVLDAAAPLVMHDDAQVIDMYGGKRYATGGPPGCLLEITASTDRKNAGPLQPK